MRAPPAHLRVVLMMGQEVGPASLVWGKAHPIAQASPACRNPAEWYRQPRLIWALGSTPGVWVSQVVKGKEGVIDSVTVTLQASLGGGVSG